MKQSLKKLLNYKLFILLLIIVNLSISCEKENDRFSHCETLEDHDEFWFDSGHIYTKTSKDSIIRINLSSRDLIHPFEATLGLSDDKQNYSLSINAEINFFENDTLIINHEENGTLFYTELPPVFRKFGGEVKDMTCQFIPNNGEPSILIDYDYLCHESVFYYLKKINETDSLALWFDNVKE
jgi:hypothetical protein